MNPDSIAIQVEDINKSFNVASGQVEVLKNISFNINRGEFLIILGPSGCGKSTLLHTILGLEQPTSGKILINGKNYYNDPSGRTYSDLRKNKIGMVYQQPYWIKSLNVVENTAFPLALLGINEGKRIKRAYSILEKFNMQNWALYHPSELSSGQQQKVSLSRALINNPDLIIADEPTGNLDFESGKELINQLDMINKEEKKTVIMVTHDLEYLEYADRCIKLFNGEIQKIFLPKENNKEKEEINMKKELYEKISKE